MRISNKLLLVISSVTLLAGCSSGSGEDGKQCPECEPCIQEHVHTYKEEWTTNDTYHWHDSSCGHNEFTKDFGEHEFGEDHLCKVCGCELPSIYKFVTTHVENAKVEVKPYYKKYDVLTFKVSPNTDYTFPKAITATGLIEFVYDNLTGVGTGVVVDDVVINGKATPLAPKYYVSKEITTEYIDGNKHITTRTQDYDSIDNTLTIGQVIENKNASDESLGIEESKYWVYSYNSKNQLTELLTYENGTEDSNIITKDIYVYNDKDLLASNTTIFYDSYPTELDRKTAEYEYDDINRLVVYRPLFTGGGEHRLSYSNGKAKDEYWFNGALYNTHNYTLSYDDDEPIKCYAKTEMNGSDLRYFNYVDTVTNRVVSIIDTRFETYRATLNNNHDFIVTYELNYEGDLVEMTHYSYDENGYIKEATKNAEETKVYTFTTDVDGRVTSYNCVDDKSEETIFTKTYEFESVDKNSFLPKEATLPYTKGYYPNLSFSTEITISPNYVIPYMSYIPE